MERLILGLVANEDWEILLRAEVACRASACGLVLVFENERNVNQKIRNLTDSLREAFGINGVGRADKIAARSSGNSGYTDIVMITTRQPDL
jgi:hypothetical protein